MRAVLYLAVWLAGTIAFAVVVGLVTLATGAEGAWVGPVFALLGVLVGWPWAMFLTHRYYTRWR